MVGHTRTYGRHEHVDARLWDPAIQQWKSLHPFHKLTLPGGSELSISFGTITLAGDHPCAPELARVRAGIPSPVSFEINGVEWTGQITHAELKGQGKEPSVWVCSVESDHKHLHRMMSRDTAVSAADQTATRLQGWLGEVTRRLVASNAQRTGLPAYVLVEGEGDPVDIEARTEDSVYDVLQDALVGSRMHAEVRMLRPDHDLPGEGVVEHYAGRMERAWEQAELDSGAWPHARTHERLVGKVAPHPEILLPVHSWRGEGLVDVYGTELLESVAGICWRPFETVVEAPAEYYAVTDPEGIRAASVAELRWLQDEMFTGWSTHVTVWESWQDATDLGALQGAVAAGLVVTPAGAPLDTMGAVDGYVGAVEEVYAWRDGSQWVLATAADFEVEHEKRQARGAEQRQTPGVLVHLFEERDRRGVVFSSASGGGLEEWSVKHSAPDAAMIIAGAQVDERTMAAAREGILPPSALGTYTPEEAAGILPSGSVVPGTIDRLDVDAQPLASIEGTEVSYSSAGGRADIARVGAFFYREKYLSLSSSGGGDPLHEMTKAWSQAQGMSTMSLTPGASTSAVFGDDVVREDGTVVPGWKPGDRVSFVDQQTRISEVVSGYRLEAEDGRVVSVVPTLGRKEQGVYADLAKRLRDAERRATKAQLAPPRRLPEQELIAAAAKEAAEQMLVEQEIRNAAIQAEQEIRNAAIQQQNAAQFALHDNQLKWLAWTEHVYDFRFSLASGSATRPGDEISTGLIDVKLNSASGMGYEVTIRPGWRGVWRFEWTEEGGDGATGSRTGEEGGARTKAVAFSYETGRVIRMGSLYIWPEHSPSPREWVVQVVPDGTGTARFVAPETTSGNLTISGAPEQQENGAITFGTPVVADSDVRVGKIGTGTVYSSGRQLTAGWHLRPLVDGDVGVVKFTEVKPALTWEAGAPLTGRQRIPIASQTVPRSTWVTLAEWTGLDWSSPRTATITYEVQWAKYNAWALADYYTRVTLNGAQLGYFARGTTGGMDAYFRMVLSGRTLRAGDVLKFEARATPGFASERKISSASADIVW